MQVTNTGQWGKEPPTGKFVKMSGVNIFRLTDGKVVEIWKLPRRFGHAGTARCADLCGQQKSVRSQPSMSNDLCWLTARELTQRMRTREALAVEVMQAHLAQIERLNPQVNAIVTLDAEGALQKAKDADGALAAGNVISVLHGLPMAHKDLQDTRGWHHVWLTDSSRPYSGWNRSLTACKVPGRSRSAKRMCPEWGAGSQTFNPVFGANAKSYNTSKTWAAAAAARRWAGVWDDSDSGWQRHGRFAAKSRQFLQCGRLSPLPDGNDLSRRFRLANALCGRTPRTVGDVALLLAGDGRT